VGTYENHPLKHENPVPSGMPYASLIDLVPRYVSANLVSQLMKQIFSIYDEHFISGSDFLAKQTLPKHPQNSFLGFYMFL
jgi:hypothetical protein